MFGKLSEEELLKPKMKNLYTWDWVILGKNEAEKQIHQLNCWLAMSKLPCLVTESPCLAIEHHGYEFEVEWANLPDSQILG